MDGETVIRTLRAHEEELRPRGSRTSSFSARCARRRDEQSKVDLFFACHDPKFGLIDLFRVKRRFEEILGTRVDAMTRRSVHPRIRQEVEAEAVRVFDARALPQHARPASGYP